MAFIQRSLQIALFAVASAGIFLVIESLAEYIWANWISNRKPWPDQTSLTWLIEQGTFESLIYLVSLLVGIFLSYKEFIQLKISHKIYLLIILAVGCGILFDALKLTKFSDDLTISLGVVMLWPVFIVVISNLAIRYQAKRFT